MCPGLDPLPLQVLHFSDVENLISCFLPVEASSNVIDKSYLRSEPLKLVFLLLPPLSPKSLKKSSKMSEKEPEKSKLPKPPFPPAPFSNAA